MTPPPAISTLAPGLARAAKFRLLLARARRRARRDLAADAPPVNPAFIVGCGRSGTTILGDLLARHPASAPPAGGARLRYLMEPYHYWAAIDPITDVPNLYSRVDARLVMTPRHATPDARRRFRNLFGPGPGLVVEKTPYNAMRLGYLDALAPDARFINMLRDGVRIADSIHRLCAIPTPPIAGKPGYHHWWGDEQSKWKAMLRDGAECFPDEARTLQTDRQKGAYEWLLTMQQVDRWAPTLGDRILTVRYDDLNARPADTLTSICRFLGLKTPEPWLSQSAATLSPRQHPAPPPLRLPPAMREAFNTRQAQLGFDGRAEPPLGREEAA